MTVPLPTREVERLAAQLAEGVAVRPARTARHEQKSVRRVRTREGARRYDQPIGSIIKPDVFPDVAPNALPDVIPDFPTEVDRPWLEGPTEELRRIHRDLFELRVRDFATHNWEMRPWSEVEGSPEIDEIGNQDERYVADMEAVEREIRSRGEPIRTPTVEDYRDAVGQWAYQFWSGEVERTDRTPEERQVAQSRLEEVTRSFGISENQRGWGVAQDLEVDHPDNYPSPRYWLKPNGKWAPVAWHEDAFWRPGMRYAQFVAETGAVRVTLSPTELNVDAYAPLSRDQIEALSTIRRPLVYIVTSRGDASTDDRLRNPDPEEIRRVLEEANRFLRGIDRPHPSRLLEFRSVDDDAVEGKVRRVRTREGAELYDQPIGSVIRPDIPDAGAALTATAKAATATPTFDPKPKRAKRGMVVTLPGWDGEQKHKTDLTRSELQRHLDKLAKMMAAEKGATPPTIHIFDNRDDYVAAFMRARRDEDRRKGEFGDRPYDPDGYPDATVVGKDVFIAPWVVRDLAHLERTRVSGTVDYEDAIAHPQEWRKVAHEIAHTYSGSSEGKVRWNTGLQPIVEEGGAEILSIDYAARAMGPLMNSTWNRTSTPEKDEEGEWGFRQAVGVEALIRKHVYSERIAEVIAHGVRRNGWDREKVLADIERVFRGDEGDRNRFFNSPQNEEERDAGMKTIRFRSSDGKYVQEDETWGPLMESAPKLRHIEYEASDDPHWDKARARAATLLWWLIGERGAEERIAEPAEPSEAKTMLARFRGACATCGGVIDTGDPIVYQQGRVFHADHATEGKGLVQRVRTWAGRERYGQEIGTIIKPDLVPAKPRIVPTPTPVARPPAPVTRIARPLPPIRNFSHWGDRAPDIEAASERIKGLRDIDWETALDDEGQVVDPDVLAALRSMFELEDPKSQLSVRLNQAGRISDRRIAVSADIFHPDNKWPVGQIDNFILDFNPPPSAFHGLIQLQDAYQGKGFGEKLLRHQENHYIAAGLERIDLLAAMSVGGYAWARAGFDWRWGGMRSPWYSVRRNIEYLLHPGREDLRSEEERALLRGLLVRFEEADSQKVDYSAVALSPTGDGAPDAPTPYEVAVLGKGIEQPGVPWVGKWVMQNSEWQARKRLVAPVGVKAMDPDARARFLAQMAEDWWRECVARDFQLGEEGADWSSAGRPPAAASAPLDGVLGVLDRVVEEKRVSRVRTREGAERFNQPIGSIIKPDDVVPGLLGRRPPRRAPRRWRRGDWFLSVWPNDDGADQHNAWLFQVDDPSGRPHATGGVATEEEAERLAEESVRRQRKRPTPVHRISVPFSTTVGARAERAESGIGGVELVRMSPDLIDDRNVAATIERQARVPGFEDLAGRTDRAALDEIIRRQADHIVAAADRSFAISPDATALHADWYPFAHGWLNDLADENGVDRNAAYAAAAVLSPGADWANNVAWAQRMIEAIRRQDEITVTEAWVEARFAAELAAWEDAVKNLKKEKDRQKKIDNPPRLRTELVGKTLRQLGADEENGDENIAIALRAWHDYEALRQLNRHAGFGNPDHVAIPQKIANLTKAVSVLRNPSLDNINVQLGAESKVRSFYVNLSDPSDAEMENVTVDTHHYGVANGQPWGMSNPFIESGEESITSAPTSGATGVSGTYPLIVEATRRATAAVNERHGTSYTPNQVQSIVWEQHRAEFPRSIRKNKELQASINATWTAFGAGEIDREEAWARIDAARLAAKGTTPEEIAEWYGYDLRHGARPKLSDMRKEKARIERERIRVEKARERERLKAEKAAERDRIRAEKAAERDRLKAERLAAAAARRNPDA